MITISRRISSCCECKINRNITLCSYQFCPDLFDVDAARLILLKGITKLPFADFLQYKYLIQTDRVSKAFLHILYCFSLLKNHLASSCILKLSSRLVSSKNSGRLTRRTRQWLAIFLTLIFLLEAVSYFYLFDLLLISKKNKKGLYDSFYGFQIYAM